MYYYWGQQLSSGNLPHVVWTLVVAIAIALFWSKRSSRPLAAPDDDGNRRNDWSDRIHPELGAPHPVPTFDSWWKVRSFGMLAAIPGTPKSGVKMTKVGGIGSYYYPANAKDDEIDAPARSMLWIHGGGRIMGSSCGIQECQTCSDIVLALGVPVLAADYRKPPGHPFPAALDDVHRAYRWLAGKLRGGGGGGGSPTRA